MSAATQVFGFRAFSSTCQAKESSPQRSPIESRVRRSVIFCGQMLTLTFLGHLPHNMVVRKTSGYRRCKQQTKTHLVPGPMIRPSESGQKETYATEKIQYGRQPHGCWHQNECR